MHYSKVRGQQHSRKLPVLLRLCQLHVQPSALESGHKHNQLQTSSMLKVSPCQRALAGFNELPYVVFANKLGSNRFESADHC